MTEMLATRLKSEVFSETQKTNDDEDIDVMDTKQIIGVETCERNDSEGVKRNGQLSESEMNDSYFNDTDEEHDAKDDLSKSDADREKNDDRTCNEIYDEKSPSSPIKIPSELNNDVEAKKARVENIITSMRNYPNDFTPDNSSQNSMEKGRKRKQYHPQQFGSSHDTSAIEGNNMYLHSQIYDLRDKLWSLGNRMYMNESRESDDRKTHHDNPFIDRSLYNLSKYPNDINTCNSVEPQTYSPSDYTVKNKNHDDNKHGFQPPKKKFKHSHSVDEVDKLFFDLKKKISGAVECVLDDFKNDFIEHQKSLKDELNKARSLNERLFENRHLNFPSPLFSFDQTGLDRGSAVDNPLRNLVESLSRNQIRQPLASYPTLPYYRYLPTSLPTLVPPPPPLLSHTPLSFSPETEQTEALSLVVNTPKKKRTKVTDTRLSPRASRFSDVSSHDFGIADGNSASKISPTVSSCLPLHIPSSLSTNNANSHDFMSYMNEDNLFNLNASSKSGKQSPLQADQGSPGASSVTSSESARLSNRKMSLYQSPVSEVSQFYPRLSMQYTTTLSPMHLRKAKLMFFYVRYPSSSVLKTYFPDICFNKNNTAQLVKWFSNFREFFYIQMEKYARQAIAEGVQNCSDLHVTTDSELYRILNLHYNRNNQLEVPDKFRKVVETALREFFVAVASGKDSEQPWKKAIYKVIQRLDDKLPDFFLSPNWMEMLSDA